MDNKIIKVALAEDQKMFREGVVKLINSFEGIEVVGAVEDGQQLIHLLEIKDVDVVILDYRMPIMNGLETTKKIRSGKHDVRILILSLFDDQEFVESSIEAGANGFLSKDDEPEQIELAIKAAYETGYFLNDRTNKLFISRMVNAGKIQPKYRNDEIEFSESEIQVLDLMCKELTNLEIAERLNKSVRTIESSRTSMMNKIGARNVVGLVMYALKNNLVKLS